MATLGLVLVFAFIAGISGQPNPLPTIIYYDVGTDIYTRDSGGSPSPLNLGTSDDRKSCFDGTDFYYTEGNSIFKSPDPTPIYTAPAGRILASIACRCNLLAVGLTDSDSNTFVKIITTNPVEVVVKLSFEVEGRASIGFSTEGTCYFIVCTILQTRIYDCNNLTGIPMHMTEINLGRQPRCIACHQVDSEVYIFVTFDTQTSVLRLHWDVLAGTPLEATAISVLTEGTFSDVAARVSCVAIADGYVYFLIDELISSDDTQYELSRYPIEPWLLDVPTNSREDIQVLETGSDGNIDGDANGLSVCGSACQADCETTCECTTDCGFCFDDAGGDTCQCENSATPNCVYTDTELAGECVVCVAPIDACVFVRMPLALRRSGPPIDVVGVSTVSADLTFERYVNTGRYNAPNLPQNVAFSTDGTFSGTVGGFSAPLQSSGRGRRFGVYSFRFDPNGEGNTVTIPAIATEISGFTNTRYCYTANSNEAVTLTAKMTPPLIKFMSSLQWSFTFVDQGTGSASNPVVPPCIFSGNNRLSCELQNVQKDTSEGVYEVFRPRRKLRNWHPLFYLFVRSCEADMYGPDCDKACGDCVNGWCDSDCGSCVCFPGWMGDDCNTACSSADEVGQSCGITCSSIFSDNVDCKGLLISYPAKVPCSCRSGLMPPECQDDCEEGYWGPNCANECPSSNTNCNVRTGL